MTKWQERILEDVVERFIDYRGKTPVKTSYGVPLVTAKIVKNGKILKPTEFISEEEYPIWMRRGYPKINDVVLTTEAPLGEVGILKIEKIALAQRIILIRGKKNLLHNHFLKFYLQSPLGQETLRVRASGSTVSGIKAAELKKIPISVPCYAEQQAIAAVLSSLDDKIDLLHRQNATLEAMAEALFIELFINNAGNSEIESITKYINFNPGYSIKKGEAAQFLEMSNLNTNSFHPSEVTQKNFSSGMKFMNKDTLLARITPCLENGKACYVTFLAKNEVGWGSTEYIVMRPIAKLHPLFAYCLAKSEDFRGYAENCLQGSSGRQRVDLHHLQQYQINSVTNEKLEKFNALAEMIEPKLHNNYIQIQTLEKLRDTLLPKLMSGEVRVSLD